jgi:pimeloyl-ACP methyl ester carboxylesterase
VRFIPGFSGWVTGRCHPGGRSIGRMTTHTIPLPDRRVLTADDQGPADGRPVLFLHAAPGSRRFDPDPAATAAAGVRLLTIDRPGYGGSSPLPAGTAPTVAGLADDLAEALRHLGVGPVTVAGWSTGGRMALALAARHPDLVTRAALLGVPAPYQEVPWIPPEQVAQLESMRPDPAGGVAVLSEVFAPFAADVASVAGGPADEADLADPELRARLQAMLDEGARQGAVGLATDVVAASVTPPGWEPKQVEVPVGLWYGDADLQVGPDHGRWWAGALPDAELHVVPGAGHLVVARAWRDVLEDAAR